MPNAVMNNELGRSLGCPTVDGGLGENGYESLLWNAVSPDTIQMCGIVKGVMNLRVCKKPRHICILRKKKAC